MNSVEFDSKFSLLSDNDRRNVEFFDVTGKTLVHPVTYHLQEFQKQIIYSAVLNNTLISLPPGLGKLYIAAVIIFNFSRWLLNGKIIVLSQMKSYLADLINAFNDYTPLSKDIYGDIPVNGQLKDFMTTWEKSVILTSPQKLLELLDKNICKIQNVVLLIIFETNKILKSPEYSQILKKLCNFEYRIILFIEPAGFNSKTIKLIIEEFNIAKIEIKNVNSPDIKECTYRSEIESVDVEVNPHIISIKDSFYAVFEKYGKTLKDSKIITGNVASLTKNQIMKAKEKFLKNLPLNMSKVERDNLINSMIMCAFLCHGIDLLHNWGVRSFYNYLFDDAKDAELKNLIVKDDHLMNQMKILNDYLKIHGKKFDKALSVIVHPKLIHLKNLVTKYFSDTENNIENVRIIILCSLDDVIDEIDQLFRSLPDYVRYYCIKTKAKCLASEPKHKEVVGNFLNGVINVLVLSNLVDEVMEIKTSLIVCLDPNKSLLRCADARFFEGANKCIFILTRGAEFMKFVTFLNDKRNEQKQLDVGEIDSIQKEGPKLFPIAFYPDLECTGINAPKKDFKNSPGQKTLFRYLEPNQDYSSPSMFETSLGSCKSNKSKTKGLLFSCNSPSLFADFSVSTSSKNHCPLDKDDAEVNFDFNNEALFALSKPLQKYHLSEFSSKAGEYDSFDELILDFSPGPVRDLSVANLADKENTPSSVLSREQISTASNRKSFSWTKKPATNMNVSWSLCRDSLSNLKTTSESLNEISKETLTEKTLSKIGTKVLLDINKENSHTENVSSCTAIYCSENNKKTNSLDSPFFKRINGTQCLENSKNEARKANILFSKYADNGIKSLSADVISSDSIIESSTFDFMGENDLSRKENSAIVENSSPERINDTLSKLESDISFVDDLFDDSPSPPQFNDANKIETLEMKSVTSKSQVPSLHTFEELDSDCDLIPGSPDNVRRTCEVFSSKSIEELNSSQNIYRCNLSNKDLSLENIDPISRSLSSSISEKFNGNGLFPDSVNSTDVDFGFSFKERSTFSDLLVDNKDLKKSAHEMEIDINELSNEFLSEFVPDSPIRKGTNMSLSTTPRQSTSPVLFSSKKSNRKRSSTMNINNQSMSIKFNSLLNTFEEKSQQSIDGVQKTKVPKKSVTNVNVCDFASLFEDDFTFQDNMGVQVSHLTSKISVKQPEKKLLKTSILNNSDISNQCQTLDFSNCIEENGLQKTLSIPKRSIFSSTKSIRKTDVTPEGLKFSSVESGGNEHFKNNYNLKEDTMIFNVSTPDSMNFYTFSTPELINSKKPVANFQKETRAFECLRTKTFISSNPDEISIPTIKDTLSIAFHDDRNKTRANEFLIDCAEKNNNSLNELLYLRMSSSNPVGSTNGRVSDDSRISNTGFSEGSFILGEDYSTPHRLQLKEMSPVINCDSVQSSDRITTPKSTTVSELSKNQLSTMNRLNTLNCDCDKLVISNATENKNRHLSPLFEDSDFCYESSPSKLIVSKQKSKPLFADLAQTMKQKVQEVHKKKRLKLIRSTQLLVPNPKNTFDSDDDDVVSVTNMSTPYFRKPETFINRNSSSHNSTPLSNHISDCSSSSTPGIRAKRPPKKRGKLKRNLVQQFLDKEAEVSSNENEEDEQTQDCSQYSIDSFIDDDSTTKPTSIINYLNSVKSPQNIVGKFRIPVLSESRLKVNVCSQIDDYEQSYEIDSFCVDDYETEPENYTPSLLSQMEEQLEKRKLKRIKPKSKPRQFRKVIEDSSPDSPKVRRKTRRRVKCFSSSDSD